jgi:hypothetical protein|tara:strand:+ start:2478 stop:2699 length:222 start_codon:yes stop_codon:yes gene_type:complete
MKELKKTTKFTSELQAMNYLNTIKCYLVSSNNYKADKFKVYRGGGKKLLLSTSYDYLAKDSMDMGTIWRIDEW